MVTGFSSMNLAGSCLRVTMWFRYAYWGHHSSPIKTSRVNRDCCEYSTARIAPLNAHNSTNDHES